MVKAHFVGLCEYHNIWASCCYALPLIINIWIKIQLNSIKERWMKIGGEGIENILMNMVFEKKLNQRHTSIKKTLSMPLYLGMD